MAEEAQTLNYDSEISAVTVFVDGARITRKAQVVLAAGRQVLRFPVGARNILVNTILIVTQQSGMTIERVRYQRHTENLDVQSEREQLAIAKSKLDMLVQQDQSLKIVNDNFTSRLGASIAEQNIAVNAGIEIFEQLRDKIRANDEAIKETKQTINQLEIHIDENKIRDFYTIDVTVEVAKSGTFDLELSYSVSEASWAASYQLLLDDDNPQLNYHALVKQNSGEDWPNVQLSFSTAYTAKTGEVSSLKAWTLSKVDTESSSSKGSHSKNQHADRELGYRGVQSTLAYKRSRTVAIRDRDAQEPDGEPRTRNRGDNVPTEYQIDASTTIQSGGFIDTTVVGTFPIQLQLDYVSVPKHDNGHAVWRAKGVNLAPLALISGPMVVLREGALRMQTRIDKQISPMGDFVLTLGEEYRVRAERRVAHREVQISDDGETRELLYTYAIQLWNYMPHPAPIVVRDHWPLSTSASIEVELLDVEPTPSSEGTENQILAWRVEVAPDDTQEITFSFRVTSHVDTEIKEIT
jgi:uncharacterized protein (TIGR02231 family)